MDSETTAPVRAIEIENVGPIDHLRIPLPDEGGVVVLRAPNGAGKTTALDATSALLKGKGPLDCRDGQTRGVVMGLGAKITVGRTTRHSGELQAVHLEDRLSIAELVDPGLKDLDLADARRIKALVGFAGNSKTPAEILRPVLEGVAQSINDRSIDEYLKDLSPDDLVVAAETLKRALHADARGQEAVAQEKGGKAQGIRQAVGDVTEVAADEETVASELREAVRWQEQLRAQHEAAVAAKQRCDDARRSFDEAVASYDGLDAVEAEAKENHTAAAVKEANKAVEAAQAALTRAREQQGKAIQANREANQAAASARQHDEMLQHWRESIAAATKVIGPTEQEQANADHAVDGAQENWHAARRWKEAKAKLEEAKQLDSGAKEAMVTAEALRTAAKSTDQALATAIDCEDLRVDSGRLVTSSNRGPSTPFAALSEGERWAIALKIAARKVGEHGLIVVPQGAWEGLDAGNRETIGSEAKRLGVVVLTAEAQRAGESAELVADRA